MAGGAPAADALAMLLPPGTEGRTRPPVSSAVCVRYWDRLQPATTHSLSARPLYRPHNCVTAHSRGTPKQGAGVAGAARSTDWV